MQTYEWKQTGHKEPHLQRKIMDIMQIWDIHVRAELFH